MGNQICHVTVTTRPHDTDAVGVFKSFHSGGLRFHRKRYIVFVWTGHENATKCLRFQMKTHPCGRGLSFMIENRTFHTNEVMFSISLDPRTSAFPLFRECGNAEMQKHSIILAAFEFSGD